MSGHSKWSSIKHKKGKEDQRRGKIFSKLVKEITVSARNGGGDSLMNPRLRLAVEKANEANMPKDNIEKAIKRGTDELPGVSYIEAIYEGYGPGGVTVMVEVATDNKNRTASEMRRIFAEYSGSMGESGCVSWMFRKKGYIAIAKNKISEDELMKKILALDVEDLKTEDEEFFEIITASEKFREVKDKVKEFVEIDNDEVTMLPNTYIKLEGKDAVKMLKFMEALEDNEDVQGVFSNFDISIEEIKRIEEQL